MEHSGAILDHFALAVNVKNTDHCKMCWGTYFVGGFGDASVGIQTFSMTDIKEVPKLPPALQSLPQRMHSGPKRRLYASPGEGRSAVREQEGRVA